MSRLVLICTIATGIICQPAGAQDGPAKTVSETQQRLLGPMAGELLGRVGSFRVRAELRLTPRSNPITIHGTAEGRMMGERWLVTELRGDAGGPGMPRFEGLGVNGFDPGTNRYVGYWVDGTRGIAVPVEGMFDAQTGIFKTTSTERRSDGSTITVSSETRRNADGSEVTTFWAPDANGRPYVRMILTYTKA